MSKKNMTLEALFTVIEDRRDADPETSWTARLMQKGDG